MSENTFTAIVRDPSISNVEWRFDIIVIDYECYSLEVDEENKRIFLIRRRKQVE